MNLTNDYLKIMPQINANEHLLFFAQFAASLLSAPVLRKSETAKIQIA